jgi:hypothetical protein
LQSVEISVLWRTEGKGDEDLCLHHFERFAGETLADLNLADNQSFSCRLPATPLTYHGRLISIGWSFRLRLLLTGGREIVADQPFYVVAQDVEAYAVRLARQSVPSDATRPLARVVDWSNAAS